MTQPYNPQQGGPYYQQPGQNTSQYPATGGTAQYPVTGGFEAAYPATGGQPSLPGEPKRRNNAVVVLAVVAVLMLAGAVTFGVLYFGAKSDQQTTAEQLDSTRTDLTAAQKDAQTAKTDLQNTQTELSSTKTQLTQANQDKETAQNAQQASAKDKACAAAARKVLTASVKRDEKAGQAAAEEMFNVC